jgi:hypothetical protein
MQLPLSQCMGTIDTLVMSCSVGKFMSHYPSFATSMNVLNLNFANHKAIKFFFCCSK